MVDQNVVVPDRLPDACRTLKSRHRQLGHGAVFELWQIDCGVELEQIGKGGEALAGVQVGLLEVELAHEERHNVCRQVCVVLEPYGGAHASLAHGFLNAGQHVL